jgi:hypothetical protein
MNSMLYRSTLEVLGVDGVFTSQPRNPTNDPLFVCLFVCLFVVVISFDLGDGLIGS